MRIYAAAKLFSANPETDWFVIYKDEFEDTWYSFLAHINKDTAKTIADAMNIAT